MAGVKVNGAENIIARMRAFNKDVYKILQKDVRNAASVIANEAKSNVPDPALGNWGNWGGRRSGGFRNTTRDRPYNAAQVTRSIRPQFRTSRRMMAVDVVVGRVVIADPAGAIFALAGSQNKSGHLFNTNLNDKYGAGPWPRLLGPAWTNNVDKVRSDIESAVDRATKAVTGG